ncbi:MAG: hypothetical protein QOI41_2038 [Myxococcales bacterium]|jgi:hypothetical protein|nr:hypothetical protein [Myxococcales bacterium]
MTDDGRSPPSALKGRLADVYVPALVSGTVEALSRRLGNRATIDDPLYGRASSLSSIDPLLARVAAYFAEGGATYEHVCSTTGVDRDAAEGRLAMKINGEARELPIAIVAERRRLREIELRVYYAPEISARSRKPRAALVQSDSELPLADLVESIISGVKKSAVEQALAGFEETSRIVDPGGHSHGKADGTMATFLTELGALDVAVGGSADDGRTACVEATVRRRTGETAPALLAFQRGESGLVRELRVYWD